MTPFPGWPTCVSMHLALLLASIPLVGFIKDNATGLENPPSIFPSITALLVCLPGGSVMFCSTSLLDVHVLFFCFAAYSSSFLLSSGPVGDSPGCLEEGHNGIILFDAESIQETGFPAVFRHHFNPARS